MTENADEPVGVVPAVVLRVNVDVAGFVPGVTMLSEKTQDVSAGRPEHESDTGSSNVPPSGGRQDTLEQTVD